MQNFIITDVYSLATEEIVTSESVQGQEAADVSNVRFEYRNIADL